MTNINEITDAMLQSDSAAAREIRSLISNFEQQLTEAIETLSYEFIDAPDEMLAPDDDPNYDLADEVQGLYFRRVLKESFSL